VREIRASAASRWRAAELRSLLGPLTIATIVVKDNQQPVRAT
jgi:hypothetical protein